MTPCRKSQRTIDQLHAAGLDLGQVQDVGQLALRDRLIGGVLVQAHPLDEGVTLIDQRHLGPGRPARQAHGCQQASVASTEDNDSRHHHLPPASETRRQAGL
jgi:hypothetical protein